MAEKTFVSIADLAKKINKDYGKDSILRKSDIVPAYRRLASGALGMDYPLFGGLPYGRVCVYSGKQHSGKAQPLTADILTPNGYVKMGDIKVGDLVMGADGKAHKVDGVFPQGVKHVYKVTFNDKTSTECSDEHLWNVAERKQFQYKRNSDGSIKYKTIELKDIINKPLQKNGVYLYKIPLAKPLMFEHQETKLDPYILGCLLGDGSLSGTTCAITNTDDDILNRISEKLKDKYNYKLVPVDNSESNISYKLVHESYEMDVYDGYTYDITYNGKVYHGANTKIAEALMTDGIVTLDDSTTIDRIVELVRTTARDIFNDKKVTYKSQNKINIYNAIENVTLNKSKVSPGSRNLIAEVIKDYGLNCDAKYKSVPKEYLYTDYQSRLELLQGLLDTDGYVSNIGEIEFQSVSEKLVDAVIFLIQSFGGRATKTSYIGAYTDTEGIKHSCKTVYSVRNVKLDHNIPVVSCKRKLDRWEASRCEASPRCDLRAITNIEYLRDDECQCIHVDSDEHLYLTNDCIVTHNTTAAAAELAAYQRENPDKICIYVDTEHALDVKFQVLMNNIDQERLFIFSPPTGMSGEQILGEILNMQIQADDIGLIVLDSVPALVTAQNLKNDFTKDTGKQGTIAKSMHKFLTEITPSLEEKQNILILINQVRVKDIMFTGAPIYSEPGGDAPKFYSSVSVRFGTRTFMKGDQELNASNDGEGADGFRLKFQITKNKTAATSRGGGFITYRYATGMDTVKDLLEIATTFDYIQRLNNVTYQVINLDTGEIMLDEEGNELRGKKQYIIDYITNHEAFKERYVNMLMRHVSADNTISKKLLTEEEEAEIKNEEAQVKTVD